MAKGPIKEGREIDIRVTIERIWPDGQITVFSKGSGQRFTLFDDNTIVTIYSEGPPPAARPKRLV